MPGSGSALLAKEPVSSRLRAGVCSVLGGVGGRGRGEQGQREPAVLVGNGVVDAGGLGSDEREEKRAHHDPQRDERHDGVTDGRQAWSRRWSVDSFFPASLV